MKKSRIQKFDTLSEASQALVAISIPGSGFEIYPVYDDKHELHVHHYEIGNSDEMYLRENGEIQ